MSWRISRAEKKHNKLRDTLYARLQQTNPNKLVARETPFYHRNGDKAGCMDICVKEVRNGKMHVTYYEVKSSRSKQGWLRAKRQADNFYWTHHHELLEPRFVYIAPRRVERFINPYE